MVDAQDCLLSAADSYKKLKNYYDTNKKNLVLKDLFAADADRFKKYR